MPANDIDVSSDNPDVLCPRNGLVVTVHNLITQLNDNSNLSNDSKNILMDISDKIKSISLSPDTAKVYKEKEYCKTFTDKKSCTNNGCISGTNVDGEFTCKLSDIVSDNGRLILPVPIQNICRTDLKDDTKLIKFTEQCKIVYSENSNNIQDLKDQILPKLATIRQVESENTSIEDNKLEELKSVLESLENKINNCMCDTDEFYSSDQQKCVSILTKCSKNENQLKILCNKSKQKCKYDKSKQKCIPRQKCKDLDDDKCKSDARSGCNLVNGECKIACNTFESDNCESTARPDCTLGADKQCKSKCTTLDETQCNSTRPDCILDKDQKCKPACSTLDSKTCDSTARPDCSLSNDKKCRSFCSILDDKTCDSTDRSDCILDKKDNKCKPICEELSSTECDYKKRPECKLDTKSNTCKPICNKLNRLDKSRCTKEGDHCKMNRGRCIINCNNIKDKDKCKDNSRCSYQTDTGKCQQRCYDRSKDDCLIGSECQNKCSIYTEKDNCESNYTKRYCKWSDQDNKCSIKDNIRNANCRIKCENLDSNDCKRRSYDCKLNEQNKCVPDICLIQKTPKTCANNQKDCKWTSNRCKQKCEQLPIDKCTRSRPDCMVNTNNKCISHNCSSLNYQKCNSNDNPNCNSTRRYGRQSCKQKCEKLPKANCNYSRPDCKLDKSTNKCKIKDECSIYNNTECASKQKCDWTGTQSWNKSCKTK